MGGFSEKPSAKLPVSAVLCSVDRNWPPAAKGSRIACGTNARACGCATLAVFAAGWSKLFRPVAAYPSPLAFWSRDGPLAGLRRFTRTSFLEGGFSASIADSSAGSSAGRPFVASFLRRSEGSLSRSKSATVQGKSCLMVVRSCNEIGNRRRTRLRSRRPWLFGISKAPGALGRCSIRGTCRRPSAKTPPA